MFTVAEAYVQHQSEISGLDEIIEAEQLICSYLDRCYYPSKNRRLSLWNPDKGEVHELIISVFTVILTNKELTYQAICGMLAGKIGLDDPIDQIKTIAEVIALISSTGLITIKRTGSGTYIMVSSAYSVEGIPEPLKHEILMEPAPVYNSNKGDKGSKILGGKFNHHEGDICLDHINRMNAIKYKINRPFLRRYEEAPTFALDTKEKAEQWENFIRTSYRKYIEIVQKGNVFYLDHNKDKRGRTYAEGYHVNTQGSSFKKAIIQLADAEIVEVA